MSTQVISLSELTERRATTTKNKTTPQQIAAVIGILFFINGIAPVPAIDDSGDRACMALETAERRFRIEIREEP